MKKSLLALCLAVCMGALPGCVVWNPSMGGAAPGAAAAASGAASAPSGAASAQAAANGASGPRAPGAPVAAPPSSPLRPFADIVKEAKEVKGLFTAYVKDEKVWLELRPEDFERPFFFSPKLKTGIGENRLFGGTMGDELVVQFRRVHNVVQLVAMNTDYVARPGSPVGHAIDASVASSLVGSAPVISQPHPERKSVLIEANGIFMSDLMGLGMQLQRSFRQGYSLDGRNSAITSVRGEKDLLVLEVLAHYATGSLAQVPPGAPPGTPVPSVPRSLPDPRSLFMTLHYSLGRLPEEPMKPRVADPRLGYFTSSQFDFGNDLARTPRLRYVNRWRLEKKDPSAALSEPVKPITYWIDRDMPEKYRGAVTAGILEWNKAFERIGFKDAIRVEIQPDDATFDTLDVNRASVRWMTNWNPQFGAIGPSHVDPRTGEILDADIGIESLSSRAIRTIRSQVLSNSGAGPGGYAFRAAQGGSSHLEPLVPGEEASSDLPTLPTGRECAYAAQAAEQMDYGLDVLEARGELAPDSPEAEAFVLAYLKDTTMHEVGHTLGLRHNFRASRVYTEAQLADPQFTAEHGVAASVMEYSPVNLPEPGTRLSMQGTAFQTTLGPYDYWAIEYAYKPLPPDAEATALKAIAARSSEPWLAFGTDEDNYLGIDPETLQMDLGANVVAFARKRVDIARDLLARQESRPLNPNEDYTILRRSVSYAVRDLGRAAGILVRQIGGVRTLRDFPGTGRDPLAPVPAAEQRAALDVLTRDMLSPDSLRISPGLQRRLAVDFAERGDALRAGAGPVDTDFSFPDAVSGLQRGILAGLMSDAVASRLLDSQAKQPDQALRLSELQERLERAVWGDLGRQNIPALRRELQRDYVNRLAALVVRPQGASRADVRGMARAHTQALLERIRHAAARPGISVESQAHLRDCADSLQEALNARLLRQGA